MNIGKNTKEQIKLDWSYFKEKRVKNSKILVYTRIEDGK